MKRIAFLGAPLALVAGMAMAAETAPDAVSFTEDGAIDTALTAAMGDPASGRKVFINRKLGNCLACHVNDDTNDQSFHGEVGPELNDVADRWSEAELRGIVVNSKMTFEDSIMPSFYRLENGARTLEKFAGKTILSAQQVEDVIAYLMTLKEE